MLSKCLFPAAGYGTRFLPATKAMPKELLPIVDKPLIQYGVEESLSANLNEISIITGRNKRAIEDHFDINYELEHKINNTAKENNIQSIRNIINKCTFSYTRQKQMNGLGDAVLSGETLIGNNPFAVILADDLCINLEGQSVLSQMVDLFYKHECSIIAIEEVPKSQMYGVSGIEVESGLYKVQNMVEKPSVANAESNLAIIGRYILTPDIFSYLNSTWKRWRNSINRCYFTISKK